MAKPCRGEQEGDLGREEGANIAASLNEIPRSWCALSCPPPPATTQGMLPARNEVLQHLKPAVVPGMKITLNFWAANRSGTRLSNPSSLQTLRIPTSKHHPITGLPAIPGLPSSPPTPGRETSLPLPLLPGAGWRKSPRDSKCHSFGGRD